MFDLSVIKSQLGKRAFVPLPDNDKFSMFDRPLPFYSTVPKQKWEDLRFLQLNRTERGDFCLLVDFIWQGCGTIGRADIPRCSAMIGAPENDVHALIDKLLSLELLVEKEGLLVLPELRKQYRETVRANQNKKGGMTRSGSNEDQSWESFKETEKFSLGED